MYFLSILFPRGVRMPRPPTSRALDEGERHYQVVVASFPAADEPGWESTTDGDGE